MRTLFEADWLNATFIHFKADPADLQPHVPLPLDLIDGQAVVSLVAFHQKRLRPVLGGRIAERLSAPLADHEFLNLRTYVRVNGEPAIFFLAEWIPNRLAQLIGPALYGLPYRMGQLDYAEMPDGTVTGIVSAERATFRFAGRVDRDATDDSVGEFLLERYVAYTCRHRRIRRFTIKHEPWRIDRLMVDQLTRQLIEQAAPWFRNARLFAAHHSAGVKDVQISPPQALRKATRRLRTPRATG